MTIIVQVDQETEQSYDADQGVIEKGGELNLYKWEEVNGTPYRNPMKKTLVATIAPGKWSNYCKG
jgi:hypothetical protein